MLSQNVVDLDIKAWYLDVFQMILTVAGSNHHRVQVHCGKLGKTLRENVLNSKYSISHNLVYGHLNINADVCSALTPKPLKKHYFNHFKHFKSHYSIRISVKCACYCMFCSALLKKNIFCVMMYHPKDYCRLRCVHRTRHNILGRRSFGFSVY